MFECFITDAFEFMGSESCAQRWLFFGHLKETYPNLSTIVHDDACHLRRFAQSRSGQGPRGPVVHSERRPDTPENSRILLGTKDESMVWELFRARARADAQREPFSCIPGVEDILFGCDIILELFERVSFTGVDGRMSISDVPSNNPMIANISLVC